MDKNAPFCTDACNTPVYYTPVRVHPTNPKDPAILKHYVIVNYYAVVFLLHPPYLLRREPFLERKDVCNSRENGVRTRRAAMANHHAIVNLLRRVNLLWRSAFSAAGSFGNLWVQKNPQDSRCRSAGRNVSSALRRPRYGGGPKRTEC